MNSIVLLLIVQIIILVVSFCIVAYFFVQLVKLHRNRVPFVPSTLRVIEAVHASGLLPKNGTVVDLGCGDGRVLISFRKNGHSGTLIGYETSWLPYLLARIRTRNMPDIDIRRVALEQADLSGADIVYCFLYPGLMQELSQGLFRSLKPGAIIVSAEFPIHDREPFSVLRTRGVTSREAGVFFYRVPA